MRSRKCAELLRFRKGQKGCVCPMLNFLLFNTMHVGAAEGQRKIRGGLFEELSASRTGREDFTTPSFLHIVHFDWNLIERVQNI